MDLGSISWAVEVDTTDLSRAEREMDGTRDSAKETERAIDSIAPTVKKTGRETQRATDRMRQDLDTVTGASEKTVKAVDGVGDGATRARKKTTTATERMRKEINKVDGAARTASEEINAIGDSSTRSGKETTKATDRMRRDIDSVGDEAKNTANEVSRTGRAFTVVREKSNSATREMSRGLNNANKATDKLRDGLRAIAGYLGVREVIRYADAWQNAENQLRMVTSSTAQLADVQQRLVDVSIDTRSNFSSTANLYARLARSTTELGLSQRDLIGLTTTINQSFAVSGATAEEASAAITQLSQGLASGALRGDEFNSVAEQAPGILRAVAESLNMSIGDLRDFAATGGITAEIVVTALQQASESIGTDFAGSVATFGQQMEVARTQMTQFVGENSNVRSVISGLGNLVVGVTGSINDHADAFNVVTGAIGGAATAYYGYAVAAGVAQKATVLFMRVLKVNPIILAATAIASIAGALYAARDATVEFGDTQGTLTQWMQGTWTTLSNLVGTTFGSAIDTASSAFGGFGQKATSVLSYLWETFKALMGNIVGIAQTSINGVIAYFMTLGDTGRIVANAIYDGFNNAFDNIVSIASQFGRGLQAMLDGDFSFTGFRSALRAGIVDPMRQAVADIADAAQENFGTDYVGDFVDFTGEAIRQMGTEVQRQVSIMNTEFRTLDGWLLKIPESTKKIAPVDPGAAKAAKKLADEFESLKRSLDPAYAALQEFWEGVNLVDKAIDQSTEAGMKEYSRVIGLLTKRYEEARKEARNYGDELNTLLNRLDPSRAKVEAYAQGINLLTIGMAQGKLSISEYGQAIIALQNEFDDSTNEMQKAWEQHMERMDAAGVDMWRSFLTGSEDALSSFKNLAINTLAEVIHAYTTQKITASLGINLGGSGGAAGGGIGGLISSGRSLLGLGASAQTAGTALGGMSGGLSTAAITSANQVAGGGLMSSITGGISAAMPWLAGGFAVDNILGLGITDGIMKAIGGLFGSSPTKFSGRFGTRESAAPGTFEHQGSDTEQFYQQGAFGSVGFLDEGTKRLQRAGMGDNKEWAEQLASGTAEMDNLVASLAQGESEFKAMRDAVQGLEISTGNAADIIDFALKERPRAAIDAMTGGFGRFVQSLEGGIEEIVQQAQAAQQALGVMQASIGRLNLQFDASGSAAYGAAANIASFAGGIDSLASLQDSYYQSFFSEAERATNLQNDLTASLSELGLQLPATNAGFRELVESQNLNTEAGQRTYAQLLQLAGGFNQLGGSINSLLDSVYQSALGRAPDQAGLSYWMNQIAGGSLTIEGAMNEIRNSAEAIANSAGEASDAAGDAQEYATQGVASENAAGITRAKRLAQEAADRAEYDRILGEYLNDTINQNQSIIAMIQEAQDNLLESSTSSLISAQSSLRRMLGGDIDASMAQRAIGTASGASASDFNSLQEMARFQGRTAYILAQLEKEATTEVSVAERQLRELEGINAAVSERLSLTGVPGFAGGGHHTGGLRIVGERGPELEWTGPSQIISNADLRGGRGDDDDEVINELRAMNAKLARVESYNRDTRKFTREMTQQGDRALYNEEQA